MRVCGIVAEYDPFHNGHLYHLQQCKQVAQADYVICVISCAFTQRGMPALFSTQDRAQMALEAGADLVLGMPQSYGCAQANRFALGGVGILDALGVVTHLGFGVEKAALPFLQTVATKLDDPDESFHLRQREALKAGKSFVRAQGEALAQSDRRLDPAILSAPNFVLGLCYLRALKRLNSPIQAVPIIRKGSYHDTSLAPLPSASAVRAALLRGDWQGVSRALPDYIYPLVAGAILAQGLHLPGALDKALLTKLLSGGDSNRIAEISEGLDQSIVNAAGSANSREALIRLLKSKRYPYARINRALTNMLLDVHVQPDERPSYARLLGFRTTALPLLKAIKPSGFPLVDRPAKASGPGIALDMRAEMLWRIGAGQPASLAWRQAMIIYRG
jgi:predicted nucleotidyltransferase